MTPLCTIGYEGCSIEEWVGRLVEQDVDVVVDVRAVPISRKHGFSKVRLAERLRESGIDYVHYRELGNPRGLRDKLRTGWDFTEFAREFRSLLDEQEEVVEELAQLASSRRICLVCFEEDPASCHRSIVADQLIPALPGYDVRHLRHVST
ncbi:MAG: DUF488 domain-containing protein [Actinobacteria bacterium]|nr:DUF488 domain-containing protein [Actinomycetota bacterium]